MFQTNHSYFIINLNRGQSPWMPNKFPQAWTSWTPLNRAKAELPKSEKLLLTAHLEH